MEATPTRIERRNYYDVLSPIIALTGRFYRLISCVHR
jgi:hypothetical protein